MHTVDVLEQAIFFAERLGYRIRQEWLGGSGGGACEFNGHKWIFIDLALTVIEQLELVLQALRDDHTAGHLEPPAVLRKLLELRRVG